MKLTTNGSIADRMNKRLEKSHLPHNVALNDAMNHLLHYQMHDDASPQEIEKIAVELLDAGATMDHNLIIHHIAGGAIHAGQYPNDCQRQLLRFFHSRGVSLSPLLEQARKMEGYGAGAWAEELELASRMHEATAGPKVGRL